MKFLITKKRIVLPLFAVLFICLAIAPSVYFYRQYQGLKEQISSGSSKEDQSIYIEKAARHILMPEGETPSVLTVTEKDRLSGQTFFANAKNGDKVIVYTEAKKAFLYDPIADKIIEVGPVTKTASGSAQVSTSPQTTPARVRFVLYNGTTTVGLTRTYEVKLKKVEPNTVVTDRDNASRQDYENSVLVDLTGGRSALVEKLSDALDLDVGTLPEGEVRPPDADFLIILGADSQ